MSEKGQICLCVFVVSSGVPFTFESTQKCVCVCVCAKGLSTIKGTQSLLLVLDIFVGSSETDLCSAFYSFLCQAVREKKMRDQCCNYSHFSVSSNTLCDFSYQEKSIFPILNLISVNNVVMAICADCCSAEKSAEVHNQCAVAVRRLLNEIFIPQSALSIKELYSK